MSNKTELRLIAEFKNRACFTRAELLDFFRSAEPELTEGTLGWRIHVLKNKNIIKSVKRGLYVISNQPEYMPAVSPDLLKIARQLKEKYDEVKHCIWETTWLNEFSRHQPGKSTILIEIEKGFEESLFYELKDSMRREVFLNPDEKVIDFYVAESNRPVIVKRLLTRAPLSKRTDKKVIFYIPTLEKMLVDLFAEERLFYHLQGSELVYIFENAITRYTINFTRLLSYAKRRERQQEIKQFLTNHMYHLVKGIIVD